MRIVLVGGSSNSDASRDAFVKGGVWSVEHGVKHDNGCQLDELRPSWLPSAMYHLVSFMCSCVNLYFVILIVHY